MTSTLRLANRPSEREFQRAVMEMAELCGWETLHVRTSMQQGRYLTATTGTMAKGWVDLVLVKGSRVIFAELKGDRGRLRPDQERVLSVLRGLDNPPGHIQGSGTTQQWFAPWIEVSVWRPKDWPSIEATLTSREAAA
jgi:hypothetical protein